MIHNSTKFRKYSLPIKYNFYSKVNSHNLVQAIGNVKYIFSLWITLYLSSALERYIASALFLNFQKEQRFWNKSVHYIGDMPQIIVTEKGQP